MVENVWTMDIPYRAHIVLSPNSLAKSQKRKADKSYQMYVIFILPV